MDASSRAPRRPDSPALGTPLTYPAGGAGNPRPVPGWNWAGLRRIGLYGGSFDPVHRAHLHVAAAAQAARGLERVVFVPAAQPPHKPDQRLAAAADRLAMLAIALRGHPDWVIDELELERPGPSYTIDTVRAVRARWGLDPEARLFLLLGSDNLPGFAQWKAIDELLELVEPVVVVREGDPRRVLDALAARSPVLARQLSRSVLDVAPVELSSSEIRAACAGGGAPQRDLVPAGVAEYIRARGIYVAPEGSARSP